MIGHRAIASGRITLPGLPLEGYHKSGNRG